MEKASAQLSKLVSKYEMQKLKKQGQENQFVEHFKGKHKIKGLTREVVAELVDSIYVYDENRIEIAWKFADEYERILNSI